MSVSRRHRLDAIKGLVGRDGVRNAPIRSVKWDPNRYSRPLGQRLRKIRGREQIVLVARQAVCALDDQLRPVQTDAGDERRLRGTHTDVTYVEPILRLVIGINKDVGSEAVVTAGVDGVGNGGLVNFIPIIILETQVCSPAPPKGRITVVAVGCV